MPPFRSRPESTSKNGQASASLTPHLAVPVQEASRDRGAEDVSVVITTSDQLAPSVASISARLQVLQRKREVVLKSRIMQMNRLQAVVAGTLGYFSTMTEKDRRQKFTEATAVIEEVQRLWSDKQEEHPHDMSPVIIQTMVGIEAFDALKTRFEKDMEALAAQLPVASWVVHPDQRGFGLLFLAIVIGECGDLNNYANPAKVWRRMGCIPWEFNGKVQSGGHWRKGKHGKLPAEEWEKYGYSPRRRSIAWRIGDCLVKLNGKDSEATLTRKKSTGKGVRSKDGPYRTRYNESKDKYKQSHPTYGDQAAHWHGMLLATKMLLKNLWRTWTGKGVEWSEKAKT